jgi:hypothetical protein
MIATMRAASPPGGIETMRPWISGADNVPLGLMDD